MVNIPKDLDAQTWILDPFANYIARVIGDRKLTIDALGKVTEVGDWVNNSEYVRVSVKSADLVLTITVLR